MNGLLLIIYHHIQCSLDKSGFDCCVDCYSFLRPRGHYYLEDSLFISLLYRLKKNSNQDALSVFYRHSKILFTNKHKWHDDQELQKDTVVNTVTVWEKTGSSLFQFTKTYCDSTLSFRLKKVIAFVVLQNEKVCSGSTVRRSVLEE